MNSILNYIFSMKNHVHSILWLSVFIFGGLEMKSVRFCSGGGLKCKCAAHSFRSDALQSIESDGCGSGIVYNVFSVDVECSANIPKIMVFQRFI